MVRKIFLIFTVSLLFSPHLFGSSNKRGRKWTQIAFHNYQLLKTFGEVGKILKKNPDFKNSKLVNIFLNKKFRNKRIPQANLLGNKIEIKSESSSVMLNFSEIEENKMSVNSQSIDLSRVLSADMLFEKVYNAINKQNSSNILNKLLPRAHAADNWDLAKVMLPGGVMIIALESAHLAHQIAQARIIGQPSYFSGLAKLVLDGGVNIFSCDDPRFESNAKLMNCCWGVLQHATTDWRFNRSNAKGCENLVNEAILLEKPELSDQQPIPSRIQK